MFDAHTHLDLPTFDPDRDEVMRRAAAVGVTGGLIAAADPADWSRVVQTATALGWRWTLGVHPWWEPEVDVAAALDRLAATPTPYGIGEIGLDWVAAKTPEARARQEESLRAQLALARERDVPVVLHIVRAYPDALRLLRRDGLPTAGGMVHSWSGAPDIVGSFVRMGLEISFSAGVTRSARLQAAAAQVPDTQLLFETDCPDQPLLPGARGEPADLPQIVGLASAALGRPLTARAPWS